MTDTLPPPSPDTRVVEDAPAPGDRRVGNNSGLIVLLALVVLLGLYKGWSALFFVFALLLMIFLHELGHYMTARWAGMKVTQFFIGFGPRIWSFHRGETEYGFKALPLGAYVRIIGMNNLDPVDPADESRAYRNKPYWRRLSVAVAGSAMHFILAFVLAFALIAGFGRERFDYWVIRTVVPSSPAASIGLAVGDRIVAIDGHDARDYRNAVQLLRDRPGAIVQLSVVRNGETILLQAHLAEHNQQGQHVGFLGFGPALPRVRPSLTSAVGQSATYYGSTFRDTFGFLGHFFSPRGVSTYIDTVLNRQSTSAGAAAGNSNRPVSVVGLVQFGSDATRSGLAYLLELMVLFNIGIGVFNLIPLPPLDGGHVAVATYERIRSRKGRRYHVDATKLLPLTYAVVLLLSVLFLTSAYLDLTRGIGS